MPDKPAELDSQTATQIIIDIFTLILKPDEDDDEIGPDTDFFLAGGNSILAARAVARLRQAFSTTVSMRDVLFARTPRFLAEGLALATVSERPYFQRHQAAPPGPARSA